MRDVIRNDCGPCHHRYLQPGLLCNGALCVGAVSRDVVFTTSRVIALCNRARYDLMRNCT